VLARVQLFGYLHLPIFDDLYEPAVPHAGPPQEEVIEEE
jgi:hypothetical protein